MEPYREVSLGISSNEKIRLEIVEKYAKIAMKSNFFKYMYHHKDDFSKEDWEKIEILFSEIRIKRDEYAQKEFHENCKRFDDQENWDDYDPSYYVELSKKDPSTAWLSPLLEKCLKYWPRDYSGDEYRFSITFNRIKGSEIMWKHRDDYFDKNPTFTSTIVCPKMGHIDVGVNFDSVTGEPNEITDFEFASRRFFVEDIDELMGMSNQICCIYCGEVWEGNSMKDVDGKLHRERCNSILRFELDREHLVGTQFVWGPYDSSSEAFSQNSHFWD